MPKLIVTDLDGTLLNDDKEISPVTLAYLRKLKLQGYVITISTGRPFNSACLYAKALAIEVPIIAHSGAFVSDLSGNILLHNQVDIELSRKFLKYLRDQGVPGSVYYIDEIKMVMENPILRWTHQFFDNLSPEVIQDIDLEVNSPPTRFTVVMPDGHPEIPAIYQDLKARFGKHLRIVQSGASIFDITGISVSKGSSMLLLARHLGFEPKDIISFGDNHNDLEMLSLAGMGVAMGNADQLVKSHASHQTLTNNQDGVIRFLQQLLGA